MEERWNELAAARVRNALLGERTATDPVAAVRTLLAVQAQEPAFSRWSVGQRRAAPARPTSSPPSTPAAWCAPTS